MLPVGQRSVFVVLLTCLAFDAVAAFSRYRGVLETSVSSGPPLGGASSQRRGLKLAQVKQEPAPAPTGGLPAPAPPVESSLADSPTVVSTVSTASQAESTSSASANGTVDADMSAFGVSDSNVTVNSTKWAVTAQLDIEANKANVSDCDCTTSPAAPYSAVPTTEAIMVAPLTAASSEDQKAIDETRAQAALDCIVSDWMDWSGCSTDPSSGMKTHFESRSRQVIQPQQPGGAVCVPLAEEKACLANGFVSDVKDVTL